MKAEYRLTKEQVEKNSVNKKKCHYLNTWNNYFEAYLEERGIDSGETIVINMFTNKVWEDLSVEAYDAAIEDFVIQRQEEGWLNISITHIPEYDRESFKSFLFLLMNKNWKMKQDKSGSFTLTMKKP